jgi:hypothetical protein
MNVDHDKPDALVIDETNFHDHFRDVRNSKPGRGDVIACYSAVAELVEGRLKEDLIYLLVQCNGGGASASRVMRKLGGATERDSMRVPREMAEDMLNGTSPADVIVKPYKYQAEFFYYTDPKNVPDSDPHWSIVNIRNLDEFCMTMEDKEGKKLKFKGKIVSQKDLDCEKDGPGD